MRKLILLTFVFIASMFGNNEVCARSWRINSSTEAKADFASINDALKSLDVFNGDTLYLDPGCCIPGFTATKSVTIIGTGFNLSGSPIKEAIINSAVGLEASNIKIEGCVFDSYVILKEKAENATFERCRFSGDIILDDDFSGPTKIISCYLGGDLGKNLYWFYNVTVTNSIIHGNLKYLNSATITNNVIIYNGKDVKNDYALTSVKNSSITNNIIINTNTKYAVNSDQTVYYYKNNTIQNITPEYNNTIVRNVLSTEAKYAFPNYPDNKYIGATLEDVFVMEGGIDAMYELKEGSPALGYGTNGYDCGIFSGQYPFVLSGRPRLIPYIYEATIPNQATDGKLNITLKIKSQNE